MEFYLDHLKRHHQQGSRLIEMACPYGDCAFEISTSDSAHASLRTLLATCPECERFYWKIIRPGMACGLVARAAAFDGDSNGPLTLPLPEICTDLYAAGWAFADGYLKRGGDLAAERLDHWVDQKTNGFWDRLTAEPNSSNPKAGG
jgi:hypothetical protein